MVYISDTLENDLQETQKKCMPYYEIHSTKYSNNTDAFYSDIFLMYDHSEMQTQNYSELYQDTKYGQDDTREKVSGNFISNMETIDDALKEMSNMFLLVGTVLAIFAALLLSNFISVSITQKQKDIGILRAMGAKGTEIFKIFLVETVIITSICIVVATIASIIICKIINNIMVQNLGTELLIFSIGSFVLLSLISIITAFLATYFPVSKAAKRKPIDSIKVI